MKRLKNPERWESYVKNNTDPYSRACVKVALRVMQMLDQRTVPLVPGYHPDPNTPHGIICAADDEVKEGLTGFQASCVALMVKECHARGDEFWTVYKRTRG